MLLLMCHVSLVAQSPQLFTSSEGLSCSQIESLMQDSKGYIWFGTNDGLDRYNGYEFKHYKFDKYDKNSLPNNYIVDIIEDKNGYIYGFQLQMD